LFQNIQYLATTKTHVRWALFWENPSADVEEKGE
jgi:hypothetical protein